MADEELNDTLTAEQDAPQDAATDVAAEDQQAKNGGSESLLTADDDGKQVQTPADFPEDWRAKLAGDDEKALKRLERFKSPKDIYQAYRSLEAKMSSGDVVQKLPEDATEEQISEYRKANGIPESAEGYLDALNSGVVIGDEDKELVNSFLESAHAKNAPPEVVGAALDWYYKVQEDQAAAQAEADKQRREAAADELRAEWGNEFRGNINSIKAFLDAAPVSDDGTPLGDLLMGARLADGTPLGDSPAALRWLAKLANDENPAGFVAPGSGQGQIESIENEIKSIEAKMGTSEYIKDEKMQARLRQLYEAQSKLNGRAA